MRYADSLLTEGEVVVLRSRQHWLSILSKTRLGFALWGLAILLLIGIIWFNLRPGPERDLPTWVALALIVIGLVLIVYRVWQWLSQDYLITNRRLVRVSGILNKRSSDSSLEKINDAVLIQSVLGRMLNFGDLEILTAAEMANDQYHMLKDPKGFKKVMLTQKNSLERSFSAGPPTPPLRAEQPMVPVAQPAPPAAAAAPVAAAPVVAAAPEAASDPTLAAPSQPTEPATAVDSATDESLEVTQTLARLADLRDSGAISAEEYEQKKDELLGRL
ncbi:MAG TPA: PH domain-containing protein [Candidatus Limnocylindrales bacterium]|nr:PH domain-containing protein [Candidatus Limnocylindrales bacterium]